MTATEPVQESILKVVPKQKRRGAHCEMCGRWFVFDVSAKGGKPRSYCDADCKAFSVAIGMMRDRWNVIRNRCTAKVWLGLRSMIWGELNLRPWNRGVTKENRREVLGRR